MNPGRTRGSLREREPELTPLKRRIFFTLTISMPLILLVVLELGLRWFGYGVDVSLFKQVEIRHQIYYQMNPQVTFRYFGTLKFAPSTSPKYFQSPKPPGVFRIFCLGGSTTAGFPYSYNGAFPAFLAHRLHAVFPEKRIELINLGLTATNSITVLDLAKDLVEFQPDLIVDYGGHNEFYGALGIASNQTVGSSRLITMLYLKLIHLRTFQLLRNTIRDVQSLISGRNDVLSHGTLMEILAKGQYVPLGSGVYKETYTIFKENLESLRELCRSRGIPLILGTQVSNLRDQPPFVSGNSPELSREHQSAFQRFFKAGVELQGKRSFDSAAAAFRNAINEDSLYADAHYRLARCLDATGEKDEALREYILARDCDELRFRTDSKFNNLIRSMADGKWTYVADVERFFEAHSPDSLVSCSLIEEHLHPNSRGNFLIAKCYADAMRSHGILAGPGEWPSADTVSDEEIWQGRHVTEFDEMIAGQTIKYLTSGWPFKNQYPVAVPVPPSDTLEYLAQQAGLGLLDWERAHKDAIRFYERQGDLKQAEREYEALLSLFPMDLQLYMDLAREYFKDRRLDEVRTVLLQSLEIYPTLQAYRTLGDLMMQRGDASGALKYYEKMDEFEQTDAEKAGNETALSFAYAQAGKFKEARSTLLDVLAKRPGYGPALQLLQYVNKAIDASSAPSH